MTRRGFLLEDDVARVRRARQLGELALWRARAAAAPARRANLLEVAREAYAVAAFVVRCARLRTCGELDEAIRLSSAREARLASRAEGPDA